MFDNHKNSWKYGCGYHKYVLMFLKYLTTLQQKDKFFGDFFILYTFVIKIWDYFYVYKYSHWKTWALHDKLPFNILQKTIFTEKEKKIEKEQ